MNSPKPFLVRAFHEWILHNEKTPYMLVDTRHPRLRIPEQFVHSEKIALDLSTHAVRHLALGDETVEFSASFSGVLSHVVIPMEAVEGIYAQENKLGMMFMGDDLLGLPGVGVFTPGTMDGVNNTFDNKVEKNNPRDDDPPPSGGGVKPNLKIVK
ncbi:MAG: ClpXP protease specificity-enhancing factor SspB [Gammaproteobacteria bacterium]